jgi:Arc/MetJ family transcription regulator
MPATKPLHVWLLCHTLAGMKMTMHIDDALLERVMAATGAASKTHAVDLALREMDRKAELIRLTREGLGLEAGELKEVMDPAYDLEAMRLKETPVHYGRKPRARR